MMSPRPRFINLKKKRNRKWITADGARRKEERSEREKPKKEKAELFFAAR
jgi:hypothetical protein